jgi:hypothetical protein
VTGDSHDNGGMSSGRETEWVSVDLLEEPVSGPSAEPPAARRPPGRVGLLVGVVVAVLVLLAAWPDGATDPAEEGASGQASESAEIPPPDDPRLLAWPGRGPWAADADLLEQASDVWRATVAQSDAGAVPGTDVHVLWAGPVNERAVVVLQALGKDGLLRVAQVTESRVPGAVNRGALALFSSSQVVGEPDFLTLSYPGGLGLGGVLDEPGALLMQVLPAPGLLTDGVELLRVDGQLFSDIGMQDDGLSRPWVYAPWLEPGGPVVATVRTRGVEPGLLTTGLARPEQLVPEPAPVQLVPPEWGRTRPDLPEDYVDGVLALRSLGRESGRVAVLGSTPTPDGRAALVEVRPSGPGTPVAVTVGTRGDVAAVSPPRPTPGPTEVALGAAMTNGRELVVVAAGPPETSLVVLAVDGNPVATGPRTTAVWLPRGTPAQELAAQGYRDDETWVGRTTLDVSDL